MSALVTFLAGLVFRPLVGVVEEGVVDEGVVDEGVVEAVLSFDVDVDTFLMGGTGEACLLVLLVRIWMVVRGVTVTLTVDS